jgi:hypothetical protein
VRFAAAYRAFMLAGPARDASAAAIGTWIRLQSYCTSDGVETPQLAGVKTWSDRQWLASANVTAAEVAEVVAANLAQWQDQDLVVDGYDSAGARKIETLRKNGKFGRLGGQAKAAKRSQSYPQGSPMGSGPVPKGYEKATPVTSTYTVTDPKEEEKTPLTPSFADERPAPQVSLSLVSSDRGIDPVPILVFPCNGTPNSWGLRRVQIKTWEELFPGIDVERECRAALAWVLANRKKTSKGMAKFLTGWLGRSNDRGGNRNGVVSSKPSKMNGIIARAAAAGPEFDSD